MAEWKINKPIGECSGTGQEIAFGEEYIGTLVETEEGLERRDFSLSYWEQEKTQVYCFWRSRLPHPEEKKKVFIDDAMLMAFFDRLAGEEDQQRVNFRFVLAMILMRKRRLKYDATENREGVEVWRLKVTGEKRSVEVKNPHLGQEEIEQLSLQIGDVLNADL